MARWKNVQDSESIGPISLDELKAGVDLREIISLEKERYHGGQGEPYKSGLCPFHNDRKPSFLVFRDHYCCLSSSCGVWGSVIDWYMYLYPALSFSDVVRRISEGLDSNDLAMPVVKRDERPAPSLPEALPKDELEQYKISVNSREWCYLREHYHVPDDIITRERLGYDYNKKAFVIPVWGRDGELLTVRFRRDDEFHNMVEIGPPWRRVKTYKVPKYWGITDRNQPFLYNIRSVNGDGNQPSICIITFGEYKALLAEAMLREFTSPDGFVCRMNVASVSPTNGAGAFMPHFVENLKDIPHKFVIPDVNEEQKARHAAEMIGGKVVFLPLPVRAHNADLTDWVSGGGTGHKLLDLIFNHALEPSEIFWGYDQPSPSAIDWRR